MQREVLAPDKLIDAIDAEIQRQGVKILYYPRDEQTGRPAYGLTVGMNQYEMPEVVVFMVHPEVIKVVVDHLGNELLAGRQPPHLGVLPADYLSVTTYAEEVSGPLVEDYCKVIFDFYASKGWPTPRIAQWVLADESGRFPWNPEFDPEMRKWQVFLMQARAQS